MYYGYGYDWTFILLIPGIILSLYAQFKVKSAFRKYSQVPNRRGLTGEYVTREILAKNGMGGMPIKHIGGNLTDHYDPTDKTISLSQDVYGSCSIAAVGVAAHEVGHAIQDHEGYGLLRFRNAIVPVTNLMSHASWILIIGGIILVQVNTAFNGYLLLDIGILCFCAVVLFHLVTLPVELNASKRALVNLTEMGILDSEEIRGARKVLSAAALTYLAALASAILTLIRLLIIRNRS